MKYFGIVSYFGMNYIGWQTQPNKNSVEDKINKILSHILDEQIKIVGAGRTDKGVHAYAQAFHFVTSKEIKDISHLIYALNRLLPDDIKIKSLKEVNDKFHARFSAIKKEYLYKIYIGKDTPFYLLTHWVLNGLNIKLLKDASKVFVGKHNFQSLTSKKKDPKDFIRTIYSIKINKVNDEIFICLVGDAFMRYMVRDIVGEMVEVSLSHKSVEDLNKLFINPRHITNHKAPAAGLYLVKIYY